MNVVRCKRCRKFTGEESELISVSKNGNNSAACPICHESSCIEIINKDSEDLSDNEVEKVWILLEDIPFDFTEDSQILAEDWFGFKTGTYLNEIWGWFNLHYSKGLYALWEEK